MLDGLLGALGNILGAGINAGTSQAIAKANRDFTLDMWKKENEYNTPAAQMKRLKEAGLNPNLMYGQINTGNTQAPKINDPYGGAETSRALASVDLAGSALQVMKAVQEIRGQKIDNDMKNEELEEYRNLRLAEEDYGKLNSPGHIDYLKQGYKYDYNIHAWKHPNGSIINDVVKFNTSKYLYDKLEVNLQNIIQGKDLKQSSYEINKVLKRLYQLDLPYYSLRNKFQPWSEGVGIFNKAAGGVGELLRLRFPKRSTSPQRYSTTY